MYVIAELNQQVALLFVGDVDVAYNLVSSDMLLFFGYHKFVNN